MGVRFIHTADWQLGKPFAGIDDESKRAALQAERIAVIERIGSVARAQGAAFVLVAGDMFDSATPRRSVVSHACAAIGRIGVPVLVIPGNHDHGAPGSVWHQAFFQEESAALAPNLRVLIEPAPVVLSNAVILPCPLRRRHESSDVTAWLRTIPSLGDAARLPRIVLVHGAVQAFGSVAASHEEDAGEAVNFVDISRLPDSEYDYIALGDWHGTKQIAQNAWYSGTPEIDRFPKGEDNLPGNLLVVEANRGGAPSVTVHPTGRMRWHELQFTLRDDASVAELARVLAERIGARTQEDLLRVFLDGQLGMAAMAELERLRETHDSRLLRLKWEANVLVSPTDDEIQALTTRSQDPIISRVAANLLTKTRCTDPAVAEVARTALRTLHIAARQNA